MDNVKEDSKVFYFMFVGVLTICMFALVPVKAGNGHQIPWNWIIDGCELSYKRVQRAEPRSSERAGARVLNY